MRMQHSSSNQMSIKCSQKANELLLFPLERSLIALPKPTIQILHSEISYITFSRVMGAASSNLRTFEIKVQTLNGNDVLFSNLPR
jgi:structure-specific recognition protein 1